MKRMSLKWISLTAASALLAAGCAAGPNRAPDRNLNQSGLLGGNNVSTTSGDADACAVALGNSVGPGGTDRVGGIGDNRVGTGRAGLDRSGVNRVGMRSGTMEGTTGEITANGLLIGNIALVALPSHDQMPTNTTGAGTDVNGTTGAAGTAGPTATKGTSAGPNLGASTPAVPGTTTAPGAPGGNMGAGATGATTGGGTTDAWTAPGAAAAGTDGDAIERIKVACDKVVDIRVVNSSADRVRLAQITDAIREGRPVTEFMADISRLVANGTSAGGGRNANPGPARGGPVGTTPATPAIPATPGAPGTPATPAPPAEPPATSRPDIVPRNWVTTPTSPAAPAPAAPAR